ncbi:MAG TPA: TCP-1/cpn60 chaperonin family protein [Polyangiales bacterium]
MTHTGLRILAHALEVPARQIAANSDVDGGVVVDKMRAGQGAFGFDASTNRYVDLFEAGTIDPTKVLRVGSPTRSRLRACCSWPRPR